MKFEQLIAKHVTGHLSNSQLPELAVIGLIEGFESESLLILASMSENDNTFEIRQYFTNSLRELEIKLPEIRQACLIYAEGVIEEIFENKKELIVGLREIKDNAIDEYDFYSETVRYCYDSIGFEKIYGLYVDYFEVQECVTKWNKRKSEKLINSIKTELLIELKKWKEKLNNGV